MRALTRLSLLAIAAGTAAPAIAHGGHEHGQAPPGWTLDPWITIPLIASALLFAVGWRRLLQRSDRGSPGFAGVAYGSRSAGSRWRRARVSAS
jgi:putative membrane protein